MAEDILGSTTLNGEYVINLKKKMTWIGQTLEWDALWKVSIESQATVVALKCVSLKLG